MEGEKIPFIESVNPATTGAVERWLLDVEYVIKRTLHKLAGEALEAYARGERSRWILEWPGQLVLNCSQVGWTRHCLLILLLLTVQADYDWLLCCPGLLLQVFWTREVVEAIQRAGSKGLAEYGHKCTLQLNKIVSLVRGQLTSLERATCGSLVVIDVHARDVTLSMSQNNVEDVRDFKWESQMRYYWEFHENPPSGVHPQETLMVCGGGRLGEGVRWEEEKGGGGVGPMRLT